MEGMPIIRLEIESMKRTMLHAMSQHHIELDAAVRSAIESYFTPENINGVIRQTALKAIDDAVKEEVRHFFQYSKPGRQAIREAVNKHLDDLDRWNTADNTR